MARPHCVLLLLVGAFTLSAGQNRGVSAAPGENRPWRENNASRVGGPTEPLVDLVWEPISDWTYVGQVFEVQLITRTDTAEDQTVAAIHMALQWDAAYLELLGVKNNGPYGWLSSGFPDDSPQDGLNNTFLDGDAFYQAWSGFGGFAVATPQGLHVTTILFEALQETESAQISIEVSLGLSTESHVFGGDFLGQDVTGQLGMVSLRVCSGAPGDDDGDSVENCFDLCPGTPLGESVNVDGCGCSQLNCDDGQFCNGAESCTAGVCQSGGPPTCNDGNECTADWCDPTANAGAGACVNGSEPAGTPCGDPTATECNDPDSCDGAGTCVSNFVPAGAACGDPTDDDCTNADTCDGAGACLDSDEPDGTACADDGNECSDDVCDAGVCTHPNLGAGAPCGDPTDTACDDPDTCDGTGACLPNYVSVGAACGDPADDDCTDVDTCDGVGVCLDNHEPDGTVCTDEGNDCTGDVCDTGVCMHPNLDAGTLCGDSADDQCNNADTCDGSGTCLDNFEPTTTSCDDGFFCTSTSGVPGTTDHCNGLGNGAAACTGSAVDCDDGLFCTGVERCDEATDLCGSTGDPCPGTACNTCQETTDSCFDPSGTPCGDPTDDACNNADTCDGAGACVDNFEPTTTMCDDGLFCTSTSGVPGATDNCNGLGNGVAACAGSAADCDDGLFCTGAESCNEGTDLCDSAGDPCPGTACNTCQETTDTCFDPSGTSCGDGTDDACNNADTCDGSGTCQDNFEPSTTVCDDGLFCTSTSGAASTTDNCNGLGNGAAACTGGAVDCDDGLFCTGVESCNEATDLCDSAGDPCPGTACNTCQETIDSCFDPSGTSCGDGTDDACNHADTCDGTGSCQANLELNGAACGNLTSGACDDADTCLNGSCQVNNVADGTTCGDRLVCNGDETCLAGVCTPGPPIPDCCENDVDCDNNDVCDGVETCVNNACVPGTPLVCDNGLFCDGVETCDPTLGCQVGTSPTFPGGVACLLYVDQDAGGANDGSSWADAYVDLQAALAHAAAEPEVSDIWVASGTYTPAPPAGDRTATFSLINGVTIYGGFVGGEIDLAKRDIVFNETILSGDLNLDDISPASAAALGGEVRELITAPPVGQSLVNFDTLQRIVTGPSEPAPTIRTSRQAKSVLSRRTNRTLRSDVAIPVSIDGAELRVRRDGHLDFGRPLTWSTMLQTRGIVVVDNSLHVVTVSGTDATAILDGFTITGGDADGVAFPDNAGGGVFNIGGLATFRSCRLQSNQAGFAGGGMFNANGGDATLIDCGISGNISNSLGGGVYNFNDSSPLFTNCDFVGNRAETLGGGMANVTNSSPTLIGTSFVSNIGVAGGGGMFNFDGSNPSLDGCDLSGNLATQGGAVSTITSAPVFTNCTLNNNQGNLGGGLFEESSGSVLSGCQINGNSAFAGGAFFSTLSHTEFENCVMSQNAAAVGGAMYNHQTSGFSMCQCDVSDNIGKVGGAMYNTDNASLNIVNTTITGNIATGDVGVAGLGGAIVNIDNSDTTLTNCVLCSNTAPYGGAMLNIASSPQLSSCTLSGNTAAQLGDAMFNGGLSFAVVANSILWNANVAEIFEDASSVTTITFSDVFGGWGGLGNIQIDPQFVTTTCDGLRLSPGSFCIDAGDDTLLPLDTCDLDGDGNFAEPIPLDLTGNPRTNATVDMGAFEIP